MNWQTQYRNSATTLAELDAIPAAGQSYEKTADALFNMRIPLPFLRQINPEDNDDPLLKQVLPVLEETTGVDGYSEDPLNEQACQPTPGVLHKYQGRVLLLLTGACAIHCRYCFRRHFDYAEANPLHTHWPETLNYLEASADIEEVIFSGGDPLTLSDAILSSLIRGIEAIPHIHRLRIHTRIPVVLPERITDKFLKLLQQSRLQVCIVIHVNHANELSKPSEQALSQLHESAHSLLNQSVLLKGINDEPDILANLSKRLFANRVLPYYLHLLDPVAGAAHFYVDETRAKTILEELRNCLPGYLVPKLVREIDGLPSKQPVA